MVTLTKQTAPLHGELRTPGDKSISHRSIMFSALAQGTSRIRGFLESADCLATMDCFRKMGIDIETVTEDGPEGSEDVILVHGRGLKSLKAPAEDLYTGNSGTTTRLISGILAAQNFTTRLSGDASIQKRPMGRIITPLTQMGAKIRSLSGNDCCPLEIEGSPVHGITYHSPVASAQVKSCILLAGLYAEEPTTVIEPALSRNHTEIMLHAFGADLHNEILQDGSAAAILNPGQELHAQEILVPGDISSAAYWIAAGLLVPGSEVLVRNVGINDTRAGILEALKAYGADITLVNEQRQSEPAADLLVRYSPLHSVSGETVTIGGSLIPALIDEIPILAVIAATADCVTVIRDAAELKVKESNRIETVVSGLKAMGCDIEATDDGMIIRGGKPLHGASIDAGLDHRICMSFAIASLVAEGTTTLTGEETTETSYPGFFRDLESLKA